MIYYFPGLISQNLPHHLNLHSLVEQVGLFLDECGQNILQLGIRHKDYQFFVITFAIAVCLKLRFDHTLYFIQTYTQSVYFKETFQASNDEVTAVSITSGKVASVHNAMILITLQ